MIGNVIRSGFRTILAPREELRRVLALNWSLGQVAQAAVLIVALGLLLVHGSLLIDPPEGPLPFENLVRSPLRMMVLQLIIMGVGAVLMAAVGGLFGGKGDFRACFTAMVWMQFVMLLLQIVQTVVGFVSVPLMGMITLFTLGVIFVLLVAFTMEVHGFDSVPATAVGVILTMLAAGFIASIILMVLGFGPALEAANV